MARILIVDSDENHAKAVATALESNDYKVITLPKRRDILNHLNSKLAEFDVIILGFSNRAADWELLDAVCKLTVPRVPAIGILCLSRNKMGTDARVRVGQKGARLVYERSA
jgi:DNA-binding NtrC family response regulator